CSKPYLEDDEQLEIKITRSMIIASPRGFGVAKNSIPAVKCNSERKNAAKSRLRPAREEIFPWKGLPTIIARELTVCTRPACADDRPMDSVIMGTPHIMMKTRLACSPA